MKYEIKYMKNSRKYNFVKEFANEQERDAAFTKYQRFKGLAVSFKARRID